jgi:hypothetical protein
MSEFFRWIQELWPGEFMAIYWPLVAAGSFAFLSILFVFWMESKSPLSRKGP